MSERYDPFPIFKEKYPGLFDTETWGNFISFGFEKGWEEIVDKACEQLWFLEDVIVVQVKEKFGGLRIYTNFYTEEVKNIISAAEVTASRTCEFFGSIEKVSAKGDWIKTLCEKCHTLD